MSAPRAAPGDAPCPRCGAAFHCGMDDGAACWCSGLSMGGQTLAALNARYRGCLCGACLRAVQAGAPVAPPERTAPQKTP
jgi:hypothetical protein